MPTQCRGKILVHKPPCFNHIPSNWLGSSDVWVCLPVFMCTSVNGHNLALCIPQLSIKKLSSVSVKYLCCSCSECQYLSCLSVKWSGQEHPSRASAVDDCLRDWECSNSTTLSALQQHRSAQVPYDLECTWSMQAKLNTFNFLLTQTHGVKRLHNLLDQLSPTSDQIASLGSSSARGGCLLLWLDLCSALSPSCRLTVDGLSYIPVFHCRKVQGEVKGQRCSCREQHCFVSSPVEGRSRKCQLHLRPSRTDKMGLYCKSAWWKSEFPDTTLETGMRTVLEYLAHCFLFVRLLVSYSEMPRLLFCCLFENAYLLQELFGVHGACWRVRHTDSLSGLCMCWGCTALSSWL